MTFYDRAQRNTPTAPMSHIDYRALRLMLERSDGAAVMKNKHLKRFDRAWKRGQLFYCKEETNLQRWMRCEARFTLGNYEDWSGWEYRDKWSEKIWFHNPFKVPVWDTKPVGHLYIVGEQGLGDEILFSQCVIDCQKIAKEITFETQQRLESVFQRSFGIETKPAIVGADGIRRAQPFEADAWVSLGELARLYRRNQSSFIRTSYIACDPERVREMEPYRGRIGISWRGAQGRVDWRKLKEMYPGCLSLQYDQDPTEEDVERPDIDLREDIEGVLALLSVLSKVVTVSTTVAHMAASQGVDMDLIIANARTGIRQNILPWRWLNLSDPNVPRKSLWYGDNVKVYQNWGEYAAYAG